LLIVFKNGRLLNKNGFINDSKIAGMLDFFDTDYFVISALYCEQQSERFD
jgi:hypothetical protein